MDEEDRLLPASRDDLAQALSFALRFDGRKRIRLADEMMAGIAADHLVCHLERCGFVLMRRPPRAAPTASHHLPVRET